MRQYLVVLEPNNSEYGLADGAYILSDSDGKPDIILIATGSEVHLALTAQRLLTQQDIAARVVNMPSLELFKKTPKEYQNHVLLKDVTARIAIEAGIPQGWERYAGNSGDIIGIIGFGASAPGDTVMKKFGFTPENIVQKAMDLLKRVTL